jgi:FMN reductase
VKVVAIGGSTRANSSTQRVLDRVIAALHARGAQCELFAGSDLSLAPYEPGGAINADAQRMIDAVRGADAVLVGSPGYHGSLSGLVKNALDYLEALRDDDRPYLTDRAVGLVVTAHGWQAAVTTLGSLRQIVHALRGWPTPLGIAVNVAALPGDLDSALHQTELSARIDELANQLVTHAGAFMAQPGGWGEPAGISEKVR